MTLNRNIAISGNAFVLSKLFSIESLGEPISLEKFQKYLMISNHEISDTGVNSSDVETEDGIALKTFQMPFFDYATQNGLSVEFISDDTIIVSGSRFSISEMQKVGDPRLAYSEMNAQSFEIFKNPYIPYNVQSELEPLLTPEAE